MNAPLYILKTPSVEDESQEESVENKVVPSSGSFLRAVDLSIFHKPKATPELPVSVKTVEEPAPPSAPSTPTVLNTLEELVQLEVPSAQAVEENIKPISTESTEQENSLTSQAPVFVKPLPGFVFRLDLGQEKQLPEALSSLELPLPTLNLTLQNIQEVVEPSYTIPELFAYSTDTIIEAEPLESAVSASGCTFIGSEVIAPLFSFSVPSIEEPMIVEMAKTIELEIVSQETMKQVEEIRELEEEAAFQQEEVDLAEVFLAPPAPSQTDTVALYEEQDDLLAPAYLITVERNTEVLAPEFVPPLVIESEVSLVSLPVEVPKVLEEAEEVKTKTLEPKPSFVLSQFQPSIAVQPIFKETSILMTQPELMNKTKETEPALVIARIARAQPSTEVKTTEKVDASEEVSATLAPVAPSWVEEKAVEKSGLVANTVNFFKGFAKVYRSSARKAVAPVEFMFKNAFTLTQGVMHLSVPLFMTYLLAKHVPFVSAVLEQTGNLWLNSLYMTSFYVAAATIWLTTWIAGKGLLHATKYAFYKLASIGQKN